LGGLRGCGGDWPAQVFLSGKPWIDKLNPANYSDTHRTGERLTVAPALHSVVPDITVGTSLDSLG